MDWTQLSTVITTFIVVLTFRGGVGSYLAEEIVDGVGEVLEEVVKVGELGGGDGVGTGQ